MPAKISTMTEETRITGTSTVGKYLFKRLAELTKTIFGVPGDYTLKLLEHIYTFDEKDMKWCGNNNELNAGYSADGYARINNGFGCLITTFGVGELSALNAIAGAFTEHVGVLHIVGTTSTMVKEIDNSSMFDTLHHLVPNKKTYGKQDQYVYEKLVDSFSCCTESLTLKDCERGSNRVQMKIDNVLEQIITQMKPGYLFIPCDMSEMEIDVDFDKKLQFSTNLQLPLSPKETEVVDFLLDETYKAQNPGFIGDLFLKREQAAAMDLLTKTNWYCYSTPCARGHVVDESLANFQGVFSNEFSTANTLEIMDSNDFIMHWGSNINEMTFKKRGDLNHDWLSKLNIIFLGKDFVQIGYGENSRLFTDEEGSLNCVKVFKEYYKRLDFTRLPFIKTRSESAKDLVVPEWSSSYKTDISCKTDAILTQEGFSKMFCSPGFLQKNDVIVNELSSFIFEMGNIRLPKGVKTYHQGFYGSIGYALPATLGVCLAIKDLQLENKHRVILVQGDGSAQMTFQELGCYLAYNIHPNIFMINNSGYAIEREIGGRHRSYNDNICDWDWCSMFKAFGDKQSLKHYAEKITTFKQLAEVNKNVVQNSDYENKVKMIELIFDKNDVCPTLRKYMELKRKMKR